MAILCNLQAKEGSSIKYRKRIYQYWKDYGLLELQKQHLAYQVSSILKTGRMSKVEIKRLKRQIKQLHVESVGCGSREFDRADEEVVTQDNVLLEEFTAGASGCFQDTSVSESASDITKRLKQLLKNPKKDPILSRRSANVFRLKQETEEVSKAMSIVILDDISNFKNLIKDGAISVCERMGIRKSVKPQQKLFWKRCIESNIERLRKDMSAVRMAGLSESGKKDKK